MRSELLGRTSAFALALVIVACSPPPRPSAGEGEHVLAAAGTVASGVPSVVETWFDQDTARDLMDARKEFDLAELSAIAEFDRTMGEYRAQVSIPVQQYRDQVSSPALRQRAWSDQQLRRSALAARGTSHCS